MVKIPAEFGNSMSTNLLRLLGRAIVCGEYNDKTFPNENELTLHYGASRTVTREAVKMLAAKGLIRSKPKTGTQVEPFTSWNLLDPDILYWMTERPFSSEIYRDFIDVRLAIEPMASLLAARHQNSELIKVIQEKFNQMTIFAGDPSRQREADAEFHIAILRASGNPFFASLEQLIHTALHLSIRITEQVGGIDLDMHHDVLKAIQRRDEAAAEVAMRFMLGRTVELIEQFERQSDRSAQGSGY